MTSQTEVPYSPVQLTNDWEESADLIIFNLKDNFPEANTKEILDVLYFEVARAMDPNVWDNPIDWSDKEALRFISYLANKLVEFDNRSTQKHIVRLAQTTVWEMEVEASDENQALEFVKDWGREELNDDDIVSNVWETTV